MDHPRSGSGALHFMLVGFGGALAALLIAQFFPSIIPTSAQSIKL